MISNQCKMPQERFESCYVKKSIIACLHHVMMCNKAETVVHGCHCPGIRLCTCIRSSPDHGMFGSHNDLSYPHLICIATISIKLQLPHTWLAFSWHSKGYIEITLAVNGVYTGLSCLLCCLMAMPC